jgi:hypothetical protein
MQPTQTTATAPRYLVLLPSVGRPVGGVNILLWLIETLNSAGYRAAALHGSRDDRYDFRGFSGERLYSAKLDHLFKTGAFRPGLKRRARQVLGRLLALVALRSRLSAPRLPL